MTSLVIGFLPVAVTLIGSRDHGAVRLKALLPSLGFGGAGIVLIGWDALAAGGASEATPFGFLCAVGALASWTTYAILNARWLARLETVSAHDWSLLTGIVTGAEALVLAAAAFAFGGGRPTTLPTGCASPRWSAFPYSRCSLRLSATRCGTAPAGCCR